MSLPSELNRVVPAEKKYYLNSIFFNCSFFFSYLGSNTEHQHQLRECIYGKRAGDTGVHNSIAFRLENKINEKKNQWMMQGK